MPLQTPPAPGGGTGSPFSASLGLRGPGRRAVLAWQREGSAGAGPAHPLGGSGAAPGEAGTAGGSDLPPSDPLDADAELSERSRPALSLLPPQWGGGGLVCRRRPTGRRLLPLSCSFLACRRPGLGGRRAAGVSPPPESLSSSAFGLRSAGSPANSSLLGGGGVDGCIHRAAGHLLTEECRTLHSCETGQAKITGGYRLPAKYVIHTVGPIAQGDPSPSQVQELRNCYLNSLQLALENRLRSVAFPCISTGVFGYPNEAAAEVVLGSLREWLQDNKDKVDRLIICVFLEKDEEIYRKRLPHFFPVA